MIPDMTTGMSDYRRRVSNFAMTLPAELSSVYLHDEIRSEGSNTRNPNTGLRCAVCSSNTCVESVCYRISNGDHLTSEDHGKGNARLIQLSVSLSQSSL